MLTQNAAIAYSFLRGETNSIMTAFQKFNCTNLPREVGRGIERKFGVSIHRIPVKFKSTYGHTGEYYRYTLLKTSKNIQGMKKMAKYIKDCIQSPKTQAQQKIIDNIKSLLK